PDVPSARPTRDYVSARDHEHARHRPRDLDVRVPEFLGARAAARDPRVGVDDGIGAKLSGPVVDQYVSGSGDPQHRRSPQRDGRQSARPVGSSIPKGLMSMRRTTMRDEVTPMLPPRARDPYIAWAISPHYSPATPRSWTTCSRQATRWCSARPLDRSSAARTLNTSCATWRSVRSS